MEASAPVSPYIEPEPPTWQPRAIWVATRLFCGSVSFFFVSFVFAYFYLRSINSNHAWHIGPVNPSFGLGVAIAALLGLSAIVFRLGALRPTDTIGAGIAAILMAFAAIVLQFIEYPVIDFGAASGGYAAVFIGWTSLYSILSIGCLFWMETQIASLWRARRLGVDRPLAEGVPADEIALMRAGVEACSFFWAFYASIGVLAFIILYLV